MSQITEPRDTGGPAFPLPGEVVSKMLEVCDHLPDEQAGKLAEQIASASCGMHLRDYFAAKVMQALIASPLLNSTDFDLMAKESYDAADAMLEARSA